MPSSKIHPFQAKLPRKKHLSPQTKKPRRSRDDLHRIAHEMANLLSVVSLSCFKFRAACAKNPATISSEDLDRVQAAVAEIDGLMQSLHQVDAEPAVQGADRARRAPQTANVYRLFDSTD